MPILGHEKHLELLRLNCEIWLQVRRPDAADHRQPSRVRLIGQPGLRAALDRATAPLHLAGRISGGWNFASLYLEAYADTYGADTALPML